MSFAITATTSKEWAIQKVFDPNDVAGARQSGWTNPIYTKYRSPFIICNNKTTCLRYPPSGTGKTSCELVRVLLDDEPWSIGDERLCQQIHTAGNLAIASTTFIGVAFLLTVVLVLASVQFLNSSSANGTVASKRGEKTADGDGEARGTTTTERLPQQRHTSFLGSTAPYLNLALIVFSLLGAAMYFIAQFYGVEALVQSAPDNGALDSGQGYLDLRDDRLAGELDGSWCGGKYVGSTEFRKAALNGDRGY
ncbi:uncharacterized protein A1O5_06341 [Cladophialophora psammophila CBS 110553]|uniref:Uncharacterized protein n=1 Tax=Cladophialophora psammophila CBS 110553 TaxID=1182543 RepID=W9WQS3_9EURO|nr:uncharacterized protein A1O5_06341 [Cladophialophora psammophila CBS 110553]EXJ70273.1 hypothetical protein A1O5_06341 [Cladophialophora psammophila CBS 110553]